MLDKYCKEIEREECFHSDMRQLLKRVNFERGLFDVAIIE